MTSEAFIAYTLIVCLLLDDAISIVERLINTALLSPLCRSIGLSTLISAAVFAFATATTTSNVDTISIVVVSVLAAILLLTIPAASAPNGPSPGTMQACTNCVFVCIVAVAWHAVAVKWEETKDDRPASMIIRRCLVVGLALVISTTAILQWALGRDTFWLVCRLSVAICGALRLHAIALLYCDGATSYPPGDLPFSVAAPLVCVMPAVAWPLTSSVRQQLARGARSACTGWQSCTRTRLDDVRPVSHTCPQE